VLERGCGRQGKSASVNMSQVEALLFVSLAYVSTICGKIDAAVRGSLSSGIWIRSVWIHSLLTVDVAKQSRQLFYDS
jgi:hypothetical protein